MESLVKAIVKMSLVLAGIGILLGCAVGWGISSMLGISSFWSIFVCGLIGAPVGFFSLAIYSRLKSLMNSSNVY